jgi:hypothetical protein
VVRTDLVRGASRSVDSEESEEEEEDGESMEDDRREKEVLVEVLPE